MVELEKNTKTSGNGIFYGGLVLSIVHFMIPETTLAIPDMLQIIKGFMFLFLTMQLALAFPKYEILKKLLVLVVFLLVVIIGVSTERFETVYCMFALVVGSKGINYKSIVRVYYITGLIFCLSVVLMSCFGFIENLSFLTDVHGASEQSTIRYCMGYIWPTDFATHVFFILLAYWILEDGRMTIVRFLCFLLITYEVYRLSDSRLGCGCILLLIVFSFILKIRKWLTLKHNRIVRYSFIKKIVWMSFIPVLFSIMTYATYSFEPNDPKWFAIDLALTSRLSISQDALEKEGFTWFGQKYEMVGGDAIKTLYNYIDSSYLQALVIYGAIFSVLLLLSYIYIAGRAYERRDYVILYAIIVAGISGAIAQHFLQIFMNPLWLAVTAQFVYDEMSKKEFLPSQSGVSLTKGVESN